MRIGIGPIAIGLLLSAGASFADIIGNFGIPQIALFKPTSHDVLIDGVAAATTLSDNDMLVGNRWPGGGKRTGEFYAASTVSGPTIGTIQVVGAGFIFENATVGPNPTLSSLALPTSEADLGGFSASDRKISITLRAGTA